MWLLGGTAGAVGSGVIAALFVAPTTSNLPDDSALIIRILLIAAAVALGFLAGGAILDRAARSRHNLARFSATAAALSFGLFSALGAVALTAAYTIAYVQWPDALGDKVLLILAIPVFAAAGFAVGALIGFCLGLAIGSVLRLVPPAGR